MSPEIFKTEKGHLEPVSDIFSAGLIFYILLTKKALFYGSCEDVMKKNKLFTN